MGLCGAGAVAWWLAAEPSNSTIPTWPVYVFAAIALIAFYCVLAPLLHWWPWRSTRSALALGSATLPESIENRLIQLTDDLPAGFSPLRHTFENCQIVGPAKVLFGECHIEHSAWIRPEFHIVQDSTTLPPGTIAFYGCRFVRCKFSGITAVGTEDEIKALMAIFPPGTAAQ
jgi:hypothetical protein